MTGLLVDLREVQPQSHEPTLTDALHRLPAGGALELVSPTDPESLRKQMTISQKTHFTWGEGTQKDGAWRVRIVKDATEGCCGGCGGD